MCYGGVFSYVIEQADRALDDLPPPGGIRISVGLLANLHGRDPVEYSAKEPSASDGATVSERHVMTLAGAPAALIVGRSYSPAPFALIHGWWFVRPPAAPERMLLIDAWPLDATTRPEIEHIVSTLRLSAIPAAPTVPLISREQAERCYLGSRILYTGYRVRRVDRTEAKLILWRDYELAMERARPQGPRRWGGEPGQLYWAVLVLGDIVPSAVLPVPAPLSSGAPAPPPSPRYLVVFIDAITGAPGPADPGLEAQPMWWDAVGDRGK